MNRKNRVVLILVQTYFVELTLLNDNIRIMSSFLEVSDLILGSVKRKKREKGGSEEIPVLEGRFYFLGMLSNFFY